MDAFLTTQLSALKRSGLAENASKTAEANGVSNLNKSLL
jgi:hypothetical protein